MKDSFFDITVTKNEHVASDWSNYMALLVCCYSVRPFGFKLNCYDPEVRINMMYRFHSLTYLARVKHSSVSVKASHAHPGLLCCCRLIKDETQCKGVLSFPILQNKYNYSSINSSRKQGLTFY